WFDLDDSGATSDCRIAAIGAGDTPLLLNAAAKTLVGAVPSASLFEEAAATVATDIDPFDDIHASAEYRREVAAVLVARTLTQAWERGQ
ncbi:MAG: xanthine dehydrogenase family protein subunit M, partial [Alphaproteobacteria bacterium]